MRTHDDDVATEPPGTVSARNPESASSVAQRALAWGRADVLDPHALAHLQRTAGNARVSSLLGAEEESPVLGVVGSGGGRPLDPGTRAEMESALGHDFGSVRVHTGSQASDSAKAVQAQAYTVGNDVVFQEGKYAPETAAGKRTLAHELTHVVQQRSGPVDGTPQGGGISVSDPCDRFEQAAEQNADRVMAGTRAPSDVTAAGSGPAPSVQRAADDPSNTGDGQPDEEVAADEEAAHKPPGA